MKKIWLFAGLLLFLAGGSFSTSETKGEGENGETERSGLSSIFERFMLSNQKFVTEKGEGYFQSFLDRQQPVMTLVICSDSRVQTDLFGTDATNQIFVIRNIGNQLSSNWGSVDYGIHHLETPILFILGHVRCGAVKSAMGDYSAENVHIQAELNSLHLPLSNLPTLDSFEATWLEGCKKNVLFQMEEARKQYSELGEQGKLVIVGGIYDFANLFGQGFGKIHRIEK